MRSDSRAHVLGAIRDALRNGHVGVTLPAPFTAEGEVHDEGVARGVTLAAMFCNELSALAGTVAIVADQRACAAAIAAYVRDRGLKSIAVQSSPLALEIASLLEGLDSAQATEATTTELERVDCGLIDGLALLADTGSVVTVATSHGDRVLPYLPRTCLVVSEVSRLFESLSSAALACIEEAARAGVRGEAIIITGPSRSADIEKTLVLGAHGPASVAVFMIESRTT